MYYGSELLLFANILTCDCTSHHGTQPVCKVSTGFETEQQQEEEVEVEVEELEKWTFCHISHLSYPILTKF